jgi:hypothetical protein
VAVSYLRQTVLRCKDQVSFNKSEVDMVNEPTRPDADDALDEEVDEPTEEEIERERRKEQTWKHDDGKELSEPDLKR